MTTEQREGIRRALYYGDAKTCAERLGLSVAEVEAEMINLIHRAEIAEAQRRRAKLEQVDRQFDAALGGKSFG
jgi:hypothetical protein